MSNEFGLNRFDVVSIDKQKSPLGAATFTVQEMAYSLVNRMGREFNSETLTQWARTWVDCEVLRADGHGWRAGKVRVSLEFMPDEPEEELQEAALLPAASDKSETQSPPGQPASPLDDLRAELNLTE